MRPTIQPYGVHIAIIVTETIKTSVECNDHAVRQSIPSDDQNMTQARLGLTTVAKGILRLFIQCTVYESPCIGSLDSVDVSLSNRSFY